MAGIPKRWVECALRLEQAGYEGLLVGGAVRDLLLGRAPEDLDMATDAPLSVLVKLFPGGRRVGRGRKSVFLVPCEGGACEVASYHGGDLEHDLARRDFTVNALAMRSTGEIVGTPRSRRDVRDRVLRFNGRASDRLDEDPLRALRLPRLAATLPGFSVERGAMRAARRAAPSVRLCAPERIGREMRLGLSGDARTFVLLLASCGLAGLLSPLSGGAPRPMRILRSLSRLDDGRSPLARRTALIASLGRGREYPDLKGRDEVARLLGGWNWPEGVRSEVATCVGLRNALAADLPREALAALILEVGEAGWCSLAAVADALSGGRGRMASLNSREAAAGILALLDRSADLLPTGDELMRRLSVPEGPEIGRILRELRTECALGRHGTKEEVLERGAALLSSKNTHTE